MLCEERGEIDRVWDKVWANDRVNVRVRLKGFEAAVRSSKLVRYTLPRRVEVRPNFDSMPLVVSHKERTLDSDALLDVACGGCRPVQFGAGMALAVRAGQRVHVCLQ